MKKTLLLLTIVALTGCADALNENEAEAETAAGEDLGEVHEALSTNKVSDGLAFGATMIQAQGAIVQSVILAGGAAPSITGAPIAQPEPSPTTKKSSPRDPSTKQTRKP